MTNPILTEKVIQPGQRVNVREQIQETALEGREAATNLYEQAKLQAKAWERGMEERIRERPMKSVLIAAGVGVGVGLLVGFALGRR